MEESHKNSIFQSCLRKVTNYIWYNILIPAWFGILSSSDVFNRMERCDYDVLEKRTGQTVVLTGASRGIGLDVLKKLLQLDYQVIFGVRSIDAGLKAIKELRLQGIRTGRAECFSLDLKSLKSVRKFAARVLKETARIDLLINNAGIMFEPHNVTEDGYESHFQVNHLSHFLLTQLLLPKLKETATGKNSHCRVINVSSLAHRGAPGDDIEDIPNPKEYIAKKAYFDSKLCQVLSTKYQDAQLKSDGAKVNIYAVHPGVIITDLYKNMHFTIHIMRLLKVFFRSTDAGADVVVHTAISPNLEGDGGVYISNKHKCKPSKVVDDLILQKHLWDLSEKFTGISASY